MGLVDSITERGPANYHHHYHNAIVGMSDATGRYNAKWLGVQTFDKQDLLSDLGGAQDGDFRRG